MANQHRQHENGDQHHLKEDPAVVIVVPLPAQGHLNQFLQLSQLISSYNIPVHYIGSTIHNGQIKLRTNGLNPINNHKIHFHDFSIAPFLSPPPNPNASIKFPTHLQPSIEASVNLRQPVSMLLHSLSPAYKRIIIIHDPLIASVVQDVASIPNAEAYVFHCVSAFSVFSYLWECLGKPFPIAAEIPNELPSMEGCFTSEIMNFSAHQYEFTKSRAGDLYNTCRLIEGTYIDLLAKEQVNGNRQQWAIGPLNPVAIYKHRNPESRHKCLKWLDKQAPKSIVYISFGTSVSLSDEQIKELAIGLEQSAQKFIWVLRDADKGDIFTGEARRIELPQGYEERMEVMDMGVVVRDWAPQLEILGHVSTGGFLSHCGWNSCMESISMGVPIAAWPMHSDQPRNSLLVTQVLKVGLVVTEWEHREEIVTSSAIEKVLRRLMSSERGNNIRKKAMELGSAIQRSMHEGGASRIDFDSFIAHITR